MVISKLNLDKIEKNLSIIQEYILELKELSKFSKEEFLSDKRNPASAESFLRRSLEAIFDIGRHILAKSYGFKELEYKEISRELGEKGVISREYANILLKMAGYRNRMVHFYQEITKEEIYDIIKINLADLEKFINELGVFLKMYKSEYLR